MKVCSKENCTAKVEYIAKSLCRKHYNVQYHALYYRDNFEELRAYIKDWNKKNPQYRTTYYQNNFEKFSIYSKNWAKENPVQKSETIANWKKINRGRVNSINAKRRATRLRATPSWLTIEQLRQIDIFYVEATRLTEEFAVEYVVDHIEPLIGKHSRGLHVPWNLQILTAKENGTKSNKLLSK